MRKTDRENLEAAVAAYLASGKEISRPASRRLAAVKRPRSARRFWVDLPPLKPEEPPV